LRQAQREHGRMIDAVADATALARHLDDRVRDAELLRRRAGVVPFADLAVLAAHRGGGAVGAQVRLVAGPFAGHDLVRLARLAVEVEQELVARREATGPVAGHGHRLVPDIPTEAPPTLGAHPLDPAVPVRL